MEAGMITIGALVPATIVLAFIIPLLSLVIKSKTFFHAYATLVSLIVALVTTYNLLLIVREGTQVYAFGGWPPPLGIIYEVDQLNAVLAVLTGWLIFFIVLYSSWYMKTSNGVEYYYTLILGLTAGLLGCLYTGDAFNLFVMIEVLSISAYALVGFYRGKPQAIEAAIKYGLIGAAATTVYFIALVFLYGSYGTLNMADMALKSRTVPYVPYSGSVYGSISIATLIALALALWAFTYKSALFPNHFWLPDAHPEAPTPVSAALSGLVVNIGAYASLRFLYTIFGDSSIIAAGVAYRDLFLTALLILGIGSGLVGGLMMIVQRDIKRLLAYSTVSHIGLIFMGISIGFSSVPLEASALGLSGALYHIINHSVGKALLFLTSGVLISAAGSRDLDELAGVGRKYPWVTVALFLGFFQLMGLPPFGGFFSKFLLYSAFFKAGLPIVSAMIVVISAISVLGYAKVMYSVWFRPSRDVKDLKGQISLPTGVITLMGIACLALGLLSPLLTGFLSGVIDASIMPGGVNNYVQAFLRAISALTPMG
ncbi:MAG: cation:proton antiporter [Thermoprotei archaeon]|nr:MAG: cation:proton antiporter [Thermoprotei archaeon]